MSFSRYPHYKSSGVEWLGEVPAHWAVQPFKRQILRNDAGVWGDDPDGENDTVVLRSTEQTAEGRWQLDSPARRRLADAEVSQHLLVAGDLLLTKSSGSSLHIGKTTLVTPEIAAMRCCYSNFMQRIRTKPSLSPKLAWYVMNNDLARIQFDLQSNSTTGLANLNSTMIGQLIIPVPTKDEQLRIVSFLDRETERIEALLAEQRRLINLLREKRQAVISHAVTKGLNPNAPMKPSGVEWLGEVPGHWEMIRSGSVFRLFGGYAFDGEGFVRNGAIDDLPLLLTPQNFDPDGGLRFDTEVTARFAGVAPWQFRLKQGDLVTVLTDLSPKRLILGRAGFIHRDGILLNQRTARVDVREIAETKVTTEYLFWVLNSNPVREQISSTSRGTTVFHTSPGRMLSAVWPLPPLDEQLATCAWLDQQTSTIELLRTESAAAVALLQERRTALISAAVTGQIDVRSLAEPVPA